MLDRHGWLLGLVLPKSLARKQTFLAWKPAWCQYSAAEHRGSDTLDTKHASLGGFWIHRLCTCVGYRPADMYEYGRSIRDTLAPLAEW